MRLSLADINGSGGYQPIVVDRTAFLWISVKLADYEGVFSTSKLKKDESDWKAVLDKASKLEIPDNAYDDFLQLWCETFPSQRSNLWMKDRAKKLYSFHRELSAVTMKSKM